MFLWGWHAWCMSASWKSFLFICSIFLHQHSVLVSWRWNRYCVILCGQKLLLGSVVMWCKCNDCSWLRKKWRSESNFRLMLREYVVTDIRNRFEFVYPVLISCSKLQPFWMQEIFVSELAERDGFQLVFKLKLVLFFFCLERCKAGPCCIGGLDSIDWYFEAAVALEAACKLVQCTVSEDLNLPLACVHVFLHVPSTREHISLNK